MMQKLKYKTNLFDRCYKFSLNILELANNSGNKYPKKMILRQLLRSSTSIGANLTEGQCLKSRKELARYYEISLKSANESKYWLKLLQDSGLMNNRMIDILIKEL